MIESYRDHAANERTFLAWTRTGLTIMALGVVLERLDLFLGNMAAAARGADLAASQAEIHELGVGLVGFGIVLLIGSTYRFIVTNREIDEGVTRPFKGTVLPVSLAMVLVGIGAALLLHLLHLI